MVAELFHRYVEAPAHRLSLAAGRAVRSRIGRDACVDGQPTPPGARPSTVGKEPGRRLNPGH
jgi:hypothetical protein